MTEEMFEDDFERFWKLYPRKVGKKDAKKAFDKAVVEDDVTDIMAGLHAFVKECHGKEEKWVCHAATWINAGRWADETYVKAEQRAQAPKIKRSGHEWAITMMKSDWGQTAIDLGVINDFTIWADRNPGEYPTMDLFEQWGRDKATTERLVHELVIGGTNRYAPVVESYYRAFRAREAKITKVYATKRQ